MMNIGMYVAYIANYSTSREGIIIIRTIYVYYSFPRFCCNNYGHIYRVETTVHLQ